MNYSFIIISVDSEKFCHRKRIYENMMFKNIYHFKCSTLENMKKKSEFFVFLEINNSGFFFGVLMDSSFTTFAEKFSEKNTIVNLSSQDESIFS